MAKPNPKSKKAKSPPARPLKPTLLAMALHLHKIPKTECVRESSLSKATIDRLVAGEQEDVTAHRATWIALALGLTRLLEREVSPESAQKLTAMRVRDPLRVADQIDDILGESPRPKRE